VSSHLPIYNTGLSWFIWAVLTGCLTDTTIALTTDAQLHISFHIISEILMCTAVGCSSATRTQTAASALNHRRSPSDHWTSIGSTCLVASMVQDLQPTTINRPMNNTPCQNDNVPLLHYSSSHVICFCLFIARLFVNNNIHNSCRIYHADNTDGCCCVQSLYSETTCAVFSFCAL